MKEIKRQKNWATGKMEWDMYFDGRYVGTASSSQEAYARLDELAFEVLTHTNACAGFGCVDGCGDCTQVARYTRAAGYDRRRSHGNRESSDCWKDADGIPQWFGVGIDPNVPVAR